MKKIFLFLILTCLVITGCSNQGESDVLQEFKKLVEESKSYYLQGEMELVNNEDVYTYDVKVSYQKEDNFKIELTNIINTHEQIILRNEEGVYVITPSLNKSFKFQSDWPYNNSQVYLLSSLLEDIENDETRTFEKTSDGYVFTSQVDYPNNAKLTHQKIYFTKEYLPEKVEVLDESENAEIKMIFNKIDLHTEFNENYFSLDSILDTNVKPEESSSTNTNSKTNDNTNTNTTPDTQEPNEEKTKETATIDDVIYPMYLPVNTYLTNQEKVNTEDGERMILTFTGDKSFTLMEETASYSNVPEIIPTYGNVELIGSSLAVINDNSANWFDNGIEYYLLSDTLSTSELLEVAKSISVLPVSK